MDWKEDIEKYFADQGYFKLKYLNENLLEYCREYVTFLNEFSRLEAVIGKIPDHIEERFSNFIQNKTIVIEIKGSNNNDGLPKFTFSCYYDDCGKLLLMYPVKFYFKKGSLNPRLTYNVDEITDSKKNEKEYVFMLFNNILKQFIVLQQRGIVS